MGHHEDLQDLIGQLPGSSAEQDELVRVLESLRAGAHAPVSPNDELLRLFEDGLTVETPPRPGVGADRRSGRRMWEALVAKLAGLGAATKIGVGSVIVAGALTGAGASGVLPGPVQDAVEEMIGGGEEVEVVDGEEVEEPAGAAEDAPQPRAQHDAPAPEDEFGRWVTEAAQDGGADGEEVADAARERRDHGGADGEEVADAARERRDHGRDSADESSGGRSKAGPANAEPGPRNADERPEGRPGERATSSTGRAQVEAPSRGERGPPAPEMPGSTETGDVNRRAPRGDTGAGPPRDPAVSEHAPSIPQDTTRSTQERADRY